MKALKWMTHSSTNCAKIQKDRINNQCNRMSASLNRSMRPIQDIGHRITALRDCTLIIVHTACQQSPEQIVEVDDAIFPFSELHMK
jgi:hypothetical protein